MKRKFILGIIAVAVIAVGGYMYTNSQKSSKGVEKKVTAAKESQPKKATVENKSSKSSNSSVNQNTNNNVNNNNAETASNKNSQQNANQSSANVKHEKSQEEIYMGTWTIKKVITYGAAGTYSQDDVNKIIGKKLVFSGDSATCFGDDLSYLSKTIKTPTYQKTSMTKNDFEAGYKKVTFEKLGLSGATVTQVEAKDSNGNTGCTFFIKDDRTMILYGGGVFFEMDKQ
ncbi:hypothetical protein NL50_15675 [Clostridium acetobutylicum]|nr:hypothetical protein NL50_15675 [Clostridium acetobutylicum]